MRLKGKRHSHSLKNKQKNTRKEKGCESEKNMWGKGLEKEDIVDPEETAER